MNTNTPTTEPTFERVKEAVAKAYRQAEEPLDLWYFDGLCELIIWEREMKEAQLCTRHRDPNRFEVPLCQKCFPMRLAA